MMLLQTPSVTSGFQGFHFESDAARTSQVILDLVLSEANTLAETFGSFTPEVRARQLERILSSVRRREPVRLVILGFPAKSPNRRKTIGDLPDLGEVEGLQYLHALCERISRVYPPGARIKVCSDGHVFADLVGVADATVDRYQDDVGNIIERFGLRSLSPFSLLDVYETKEGATMRERLMEEHGEELGALRRQVARDLDARSLFNGIHRFLFEDMLAGNKGSSRTWVRNRAKEAAYEVIQRSQAFSALVDKAFPEALRLSIHPQPRGAWKVGVKLVPGADRWATPWHNVLLKEEGRSRLVPRHQAESLGAKLKSSQGYAYFELGRGEAS